MLGISIDPLRTKRSLILLVIVVINVVIFVVLVPILVGITV
jgi:hypothetical protein